MSEPRRGAWCRRVSARPGRRGIRAGVERQDDPDAPRDRGVSARWRDGGVHRRGARARRAVRTSARRRHQEPAGEPARHGRAGARDHRDPRPKRRGGSGGGRLGRRARAQGRDRGRDG